jgi:hypothetical protein
MTFSKEERTEKLKNFSYKPTKCECFLCTYDIPIDDLTVHDDWELHQNTLKRQMKKDLTVQEILEELTTNYQRIEAIHGDLLSISIHLLMGCCASYMEMLAIKKSYLAKGRCCFCSKCAIKAIKI